MLIDYRTAVVRSLPRFKGGEKELTASMFADGAVRILKGRLAPGASIGLHRHETSSETIYVLSGAGRAVIDGVEERLRSDMAHYCPKGSEHTLVNDGDEDLVFFAVVPEQ